MYLSAKQPLNIRMLQTDRYKNMSLHGMIACSATPLRSGGFAIRLHVQLKVIKI